MGGRGRDGRKRRNREEGERQVKEGGMEGRGGIWMREKDIYRREIGRDGRKRRNRDEGERYI